MVHLITPLTQEDQNPVMDIFNHYIEHSFSAYPETMLPYPNFGMLLNMAQGYPAGAIKNPGGELLGYGMLRPYSPIPAFSETAEISYFLHPDHTGKGLGRNLLDYLEKGAREKGVKNILASISSLNPGSMKFHEQNGFIPCGCFKGVGRKKGRIFDVVWMQKSLA
ncbi:MAG: N-acetyltransferase [Desulfobacteraceae bacterium]|nr:N-acetyltransferase [Desulfobacteraceae bacterium]